MITLYIHEALHNISGKTHLLFLTQSEDVNETRIIKRSKLPEEG